jgi:CRISPR/Cas system Type II protein with McrA/HNH and RuvC-like nuclease domain
MRWSHHLLDAGYTISALYDTGSFGNQTHIDWRLLIERHHCPFIKNELILKNPVGQDLINIEKIIAFNSKLLSEMRSFWEEVDEVLAFKPSI